jgi:hypothetical protein
MAILRGEREHEQRETARQAHAMREQARRLRSVARGSAEEAASILNDTRAARQQAWIATRSDKHAASRRTVQ